MDIFSVLVGALTALLAGIVAASAVLRRSFRKRWIEIALEMGLLRYTRDPRHIKPVWPGGHDNLPDAVEQVHNQLSQIERRGNG